MTPQVLWIIGALLLIGCSEPSGPASSTGNSPESGLELSWEEQIAAVRAGRSDTIRLSESIVSSEQFRQLSEGCDALTTLLLDRAELADDDLAALQSVPRLQWLKLPGAIGDDGVNAISACRGLDKLNLPEANFSDEGLSRLASLKRLELLRFGTRRVTDAGIEHLTVLPRLRFLHLIGVPITDAGLSSVAKIETLESFYLDGGNVTDAGLSKLLTDRPDLHFHKDQQHLPDDPNAHRHD